MNALEPGSTLGGYRILARLRAGAMGVLYLARRIGPAGFSRPVAIKVIHDHLAQNKRFCRMFVDEAKLSARIDDPHVVRVEEFGVADGRYYLVMEYVDGASLAQTIGVLRKRGKIPIDHAVAIAMQIAAGLHGAHEATDEAGTPLGIVHRDVSPHNVLVSYKGTVRVIDFGVAKAAQVGGQTKTGSLRGKLAYMPPEQARSARTVDRRADLYGVGLVLWEMLTFRRVFDADTDLAILNQIRDPQIIPPSSLVPAIPRALDAVLLKVLANDPAERPATGAELQLALADALPAALRVLPSDLAALMKKVRLAADAAAGTPDADDDGAALYGEELKRTIATFVGSMNEGGELGSVIEPPPPSSGGAPASAKPASVRRAVAVEEETKKPQGPSQAGGVVAVRPGDGVRPVSKSPSSSPDVLIPPPPLSSSRGLPMSAPPSSPELPRAGGLTSGTSTRPAAFADLAPEAAPVSTGATGEQPLAMRQKIILAILAPTIAGVIIALTLLASHSSEPRASAMPPTVRDAATPSVTVAATLVAPIVIAPPMAAVDDVDAGAPAEIPSAKRKPRR